MQKTVEANGDLEAEAKKKAVAAYQEAVQVMKGVEQSRARRERWLENIRNAPENRKKFEADLQLPAPKIEFDRLTIDELETQLKGIESVATELGQRRDTLDGRPAQRKNRREEIIKLQPVTREKLEDVSEQLKTLTSGEDDPPELTRARRILLFAKKRSLEEELLLYGKEIEHYDATDKNILLERDVIARQLSQNSQLVKQLAEALTQRRQSEADMEVFRAEQRARNLKLSPDMPTNIVALAERNVTLAKLFVGAKGMPAQLSEASKEQALLEKQMRETEARYKSVSEKAEVLGSTDVIGELLRQEWANLPNVGRHKRNIEQRQKLIAKIEVAKIDLEQERDGMFDLDQRVAQELAAVVPPPTGAAAEAYGRHVRELLEKQRDYLDSLIDDQQTHVERMRKMNVAEQHLIVTLEKYGAYIAERILWIRSAPPVWQDDPFVAWRSISGLFSAENLQAVRATLNRDLRRSTPLHILFLLAMAGGMVGRHFIRKKMRTLGEQATRPGMSSMAPTFRAVLFTVLMAMVWPAAVLYVSWRISADPESGELLRSITVGLNSLAAIFFTMSLFRQVCRRKGVAESHFGWSPTALSSLRRGFFSLMAIGLPMVFVVMTLDAMAVTRRQDSLGRIVFIAGLVLLSVFGGRLIGPFGLLVQNALGGDEEHRRKRMRMFWAPLFIGTPLVLGVIAALGYYYTAMQLTWRLVISLWLAMALVVTHGLMSRWLLMARRSLALDNARKRRAAMNQSAEAAANTASAGGTIVPEEVDLASVNAQTQRLTNTFLIAGMLMGLWLTWVEVLPALGVLRRVDLWSNADHHITLADMLAAAIIGLVTFIASSNIPGLLEVTILQRLPMDTGGRYAVTALSRYAITIFGLIFAFNAMGIGWSQVQWLAAAITVGVGIGLQDIFANFFSGLILLFERPIRIGDTVTVGGTSGKVMRIHMRATTIMDPDRKEMIIPNKELITGQVMNWTLSDSTIRLVIPVGVSYGTDPTLATNLLLKVATEHPRVLNDPKPLALFRGFGDSSLDMELRVFLPSVDYQTTTQHDLLQAINRAFKEAGIEIPFPQRDLHLHGMPLPIGLTTTEETPTPSSAAGTTSPSAPRAGETRPSATSSAGSPSMPPPPAHFNLSLKTPPGRDGNGKASK